MSCVGLGVNDHMLLSWLLSGQAMNRGIIHFLGMARFTLSQ